jgi:hypothetical protein
VYNIHPCTNVHFFVLMSHLIAQCTAMDNLKLSLHVFTTRYELHIYTQFWLIFVFKRFITVGRRMF